MGLEHTDDHAKPLRGAQGTRSTAPGAGMRARTTLRSGRDLAGPITPVCVFGGNRGLRPVRRRATFLVGGFVPDHDEVRSLLVGLPDPDRPCGLIFCGRVDHGQLPASRRRVRELLAPLVTGQSPFAEPPVALLGGRWSRPGPDEPAPVFVRPALAVEVSFLGWGSGRLRHPAYGGLTRIL